MTAYKVQTKPSRQSRTGILITNLGTPDEPSTGALRRYLAEFLSDPRVIELPRLLWWLILHGIILRIRPKKSARMYARIWTDEGSPLMVATNQLADRIQRTLDDEQKNNIEVVVGMRYGQPSIASALKQLRDADCERILILPLYPQYSATTTASTFDAVSQELQHWRWIPEVRFVSHYFDWPEYNTALCNSIRTAFETQGKPDKLLFSFHGIPQRYVDSGDPYFDHCQKTALQVAGELDLAAGDWDIAFQSRVGREPWLQPYTDVLLKQWGNAGIEHVQVICPGFAADCLETLEEIALAAQKDFLAAGGKKFHYIPALNANADHVTSLCHLIRLKASDWQGFGSQDSD